ncbi:Ankyrin repeat-containing domain protein [Rhypophila sp. PSN 637]
MANKGIVPGQIPDIRPYLEKKKNDYRSRRPLWLSAPPKTYEFPPAHWSPDVCMLVRLPTELMFMIIQDLYQADLFHLAVTCRRMADCTLSTLYTRDITRFGCMALRWACTFGVVPTLERTIQYGAPANYVFPSDSAIGCEWILGGTTHVEYRYTDTSALVTAILADEPEAIRALCAHGADVNAYYDTRLDVRSYNKWYPIHFAMGDPTRPVQRPGVRPGNPEIVRILLDAGADPNQESIVTSSIMQRQPPATPLFLAMQSTVPVETVKLLLERGANPSIRAGLDSSGPEWSWIQRSQPSGMWPGQPPLQMLLLPDPPYSNWSWGMDWDKLELLLAYGGADDSTQVIKRVGPYGTTWVIIPRYPLLYDNLDYPHIIRLTRIILAQRPNLADYTTRCGISPIQAIIWWAEVRSRLRSVEDIEVISDVQNKMCELVTMMAEASLTTRKPVVVARGRPLGRPMSTIIDSPIWIAKMGHQGVHKVNKSMSHPTPLSYVCGPFRFSGATRLIPILLRYGANINARCSAGVTPLHHAVMFNETGTALRLLVNFCGGPAHSGLNINAQDNWGWTPLHYACHFGFRQRQGDQADAVKILLDNGADIHAETYTGVTPLLLAFWTCNLPVVKMLLDRGASKQDLAVLSSQPDATSSEIPLVDDKGIIFEHTEHTWEPFGREERELGQDIVEIITLLSPFFDGRTLKGLKSRHEPYQYSEEYEVRVRTERFVEMNDTFTTGKLPNEESGSANRDAQQQPDIRSEGPQFTGPGTLPLPPMPMKDGRTKDSQTSGFTPYGNKKDVYQDCATEIQKMTKAWFSIISFNTPHLTSRREHVHFASFDLSIYTIDVFTYYRYRLCASSAPWIHSR